MRGHHHGCGVARAEPSHGSSFEKAQGFGAPLPERWRGPARVTALGLMVFVTRHAAAGKIEPADHGAERA
jgi:hypothetical protein